MTAQGVTVARAWAVIDRPYSSDGDFLSDARDVNNLQNFLGCQ